MYEELIKRLRSVKDSWQTEEESWMLQAADAIEELSKTRWIPVTEQLPEERKWVLCQCRAKIRMVLRLQNGYWHQDSEHEFMKSFVTHWMPLPPPPKEEE